MKGTGGRFDAVVTTKSTEGGKGSQASLACYVIHSWPARNTAASRAALFFLCRLYILDVQLNAIRLRLTWVYIMESSNGTEIPAPPQVNERVMAHSPPLDDSESPKKRVKLGNENEDGADNERTTPKGVAPIKEE